MLLEELGYLASKLLGRSVQRTRAVQDARECSLFLKSHLASRTALQVCTKSFQFPAAEFIVEIAQDVNSVIARVHSVASRIPIVGIHSLEHPGSKNIPLRTAFRYLRKETATPGKTRPDTSSSSPGGWQQNGSKHAIYSFAVHENPSAVTKLQSVSAATSLIPLE